MEKLHNTLEDLLKTLPSRIYVKDTNHPEHQLVIEKFPNGNWHASYVCLSCKGKTASYALPTLKEALTYLYNWLLDVRKMGEIVREINYE